MQKITTRVLQAGNIIEQFNQHTITVFFIEWDSSGKFEKFSRMKLGLCIKINPLHTLLLITSPVNFSLSDLFLNMKPKDLFVFMFN